MKNTDRARKLRKNQTDAESALWQRIRNRQLSGFKFRRQVPIGQYIVDFVCLSLMLVIEIDGSQHMDNQAYDAQRTDYLKSEGYIVVRFWNNDVLSQIASILESLTLTLSQRERELDELG